MLLFTVAIKLVVSVYLLNPSTIVPLGMHISNPVTKGMIGEKIKQHYFGILPLVLNDTKALKVKYNFTTFNHSICISNEHTTLNDTIYLKIFLCLFSRYFCLFH